jgi:hypothetical protein
VTIGVSAGSSALGLVVLGVVVYAVWRRWRRKTVEPEPTVGGGSTVDRTDDDNTDGCLNNSNYEPFGDSRLSAAPSDGKPEGGGPAAAMPQPIVATLRRDFHGRGTRKCAPRPPLHVVTSTPFAASESSAVTPSLSRQLKRTRLTTADESDSSGDLERGAATDAQGACYPIEPVWTCVLIQGLFKRKNAY